MKIKKSGAKFSKIVEIGDQVKNKKDILKLHRGINNVCNIHIDRFIYESIDFNSDSIQDYPQNNGMPQFKSAINEYYFKNDADNDNIFAIQGAMNGLDLIFRTLDFKRVFIPSWSWRSYKNILKLNNQAINYYKDTTSIRPFETTENEQNINKDSAIIINYPRNPTGETIPKKELIERIKFYSKIFGAIIIDCPYYDLFHDDNLFYKIKDIPKVIIVHSFSKNIGLSGFRIGFIHSKNRMFNEQLKTNILYNLNGVSTISQNIISELLTTEAGEGIIRDYQEATTHHIKKNIKYLKKNGLLPHELYEGKKIKGIFAVIIGSHNNLLNNNISSVPASFFTNEPCNGLSRICLSVNHRLFKAFFNEMLKGE